MAKIEHFALFAADPVALKDFYVAALGLRVAVDKQRGHAPGFLPGR